MFDDSWPWSSSRSRLPPLALSFISLARLVTTHCLTACQVFVLCVFNKYSWPVVSFYTLCYLPRAFGAVPSAYCWPLAGQVTGQVSVDTRSHFVVDKSGCKYSLYGQVGRRLLQQRNFRGFVDDLNGRFVVYGDRSSRHHNIFCLSTWTLCPTGFKLFVLWWLIVSVCLAACCCLQWLWSVGRLLFWRRGQVFVASCFRQLAAACLQLLSLYAGDFALLWRSCITKRTHTHSAGLAFLSYCGFC